MQVNSKNMQWLRMSLLLIVVVILFTGCTAIKDSEETNDHSGNESFQKGNVTTYFYHSENCHYCGIVKPYVEYLSSEMSSDSIKFDFCDVQNPAECSQESVELKEKIGLKFIPTIVVVVNNTTKKFVGWKEICDLGTYYQQLGKELPVLTCHGKNYSVQECIDCHRENELDLPSKFDCTCPELN